MHKTPAAFRRRRRDRRPIAKISRKCLTLRAPFRRTLRRKAKDVVMQSKQKSAVIATKVLKDRADDCFELAESHHAQAESEHEGASRQLANAAVQEVIATNQHRNADQLEAKAKTLEGLGRALLADAAEIDGKS